MYDFLKLDSRFKAIGFVMLQKVEDSCKYEIYKIKEDEKSSMNDILYFARVLKNGKLSVRDRIGHYRKDLESCFNDYNNNRLELL